MEEDPSGTRTGCFIKKRYIWLYMPCAIALICFVGFLPTFVQTSKIPLPGKWPSTSCNVTNVTLDYVNEEIRVQFRYLSDQTGEKTFDCSCIQHQTGGRICKMMDCGYYNFSQSFECVYNTRNVAQVYFESEVDDNQSSNMIDAIVLVSVWGGTILFIAVGFGLLIKFAFNIQPCSETYDFDGSFGEAMKIPRVYRPMFLKDLKSNETILWSQEVNHPKSVIMMVILLTLAGPGLMLGLGFGFGVPFVALMAVPMAVFMFPFAIILLCKSCFVVTNHRVVLCSSMVFGVSVKWIEYHDFSRMSVSKQIEFSRHGSLHVGNSVHLIIFSDLEDVHAVESIVAKHLHPSQIKALYGEMPAHFITYGNHGQQWEPAQPKTLLEQKRTIHGVDEHRKFVPIFKVNRKGCDVSYPIELSSHIDRQTYIDTITAYNNFVAKNEPSVGQFVAMFVLTMTMIGVIYMVVVTTKQAKANTEYIANMNVLLHAKGLEFKTFMVGSGKHAVQHTGMLVL